MYRVIWTALLIIILASFSETSPVVELNQTKAFQTIKTELDDFRVEQRRQGKLLEQLSKPDLRSYGANCAEAIASSNKKSGIYEILIPSYSSQPFKVACDVENHGGGWTILLRRVDGSVDFYRDWNVYKKGFGDLDGEFFLGLDKIHALTAERSQELLVVLEDFEGAVKYESYEKFAIGDEDESYILHTLGKPEGTAGDSLTGHHDMKFTTMDRHNDPNTDNCAQRYMGGWWYRKCHSSHLTGRYKNNEHGKGINWFSFRGHEYSLKRALMMIRPRK